MKLMEISLKRVVSEDGLDADWFEVTDKWEYDSPDGPKYKETKHLYPRPLEALTQVTQLANDL